MKEKKKLVISVSLIVVLILAVIGISYAAFTYIGRGEKVNQITTGTISMDYLESDNVISINNALPTTDETGKVRLRDGEYFDFSVTTTLSGDAVINYEIAAEDFEDNTFDGSNVKFYLTKLVGSEEIEVNSNLPAVYNEQTSENKKTGRPAGMMSLLTGSTSTQGEETINYRLRLYVDESYNPQGDGGNLVFKTRINVYGKVMTVGEPIMKNTAYGFGFDGDIAFGNAFGGETDINSFNVDFGGYQLERTNITSIVVKDDTLVPVTSLATWDLSQAGDNSVIAYVEIDNLENISSGATKYRIVIGGNGKVIAPEDSSGLFSAGEFWNLEKLDLQYLDTSNVTNMSGMFWGTQFVNNLDLSYFNTFNVTNMRSMFSGCNGLETLNVVNFNTSNVTNMRSMFFDCKSLSTLDLNSFDTSKVTDMNMMFERCSSLTNLNLSSFDTSSVTNMGSMFSNCSNLINLDLSNFSTSNVDSMICMFTGCSSLVNLNLTSFDTSKVTAMNYMFTGCSSLVNLNLTSFDTSKVIAMNYMFSNCKSLTDITVSSLWTVEGANISYMFNNCGVDHVTVV